MSPFALFQMLSNYHWSFFSLIQLFNERGKHCGEDVILEIKTALVVAVVCGCEGSVYLHE